MIGAAVRPGRVLRSRCPPRPAVRFGRRRGQRSQAAAAGLGDGAGQADGLQSGEQRVGGVAERQLPASPGGRRRGRHEDLDDRGIHHRRVVEVHDDPQVALALDEVDENGPQRCAAGGVEATVGRHHDHAHVPGDVERERRARGRGGRARARWHAAAGAGAVVLGGRLVAVADHGDAAAWRLTASGPLFTGRGGAARRRGGLLVSSHVWRAGVGSDERGCLSHWVSTHGIAPKGCEGSERSGTPARRGPSLLIGCWPNRATGFQLVRG